MDGGQGRYEWTGRWVGLTKPWRIKQEIECEAIGSAEASTGMILFIEGINELMPGRTLCSCKAIPRDPYWPL